MLGWVLMLDREATRAIYSRIESGGAAECGCAYCLNFLAVRDRHVPPALTAVLRKLEIDPQKDLEVVEYAPDQARTRLYSATYYVVGQLLDGERSLRDPQEIAPGFSIGLESGAAMYLIDEWRGVPIVTVEWFGRLPWVLDERPG